MGLLDLINKDENFEYISLKEAISFLAEKTNSTIQEVAIYLLNKDVPQELTCHTRASDYKIKETSGKRYDFGVFRPYGRNWAFEYLTNISERHNCTSWDDLNSYSAGYWENWDIIFNGRNIGLLENTYWYRQAFYNFEHIQSLNLFNENLFESNQSLIPIWDTNYLELQKNEVPDLIEIDPNIYVNESLNFENEPTYQEVKKHPLFFKNDVFTVQEATCLISNYDPHLVGNKSRKVIWLNENPRYVEAENFIYSALRGGVFEEIDHEFYVVKSENLKSFLSSKDIFIDGFNEKDSPASNNSLTGLVDLKKTIASLELNVAIEQDTVKTLNQQIEKLKAELLEKDQKIKELESLPQKENTDLMSLIFDETATDRYAPDLVLSIKLWEHLYIKDVANTDKHSNRSNYWVLKNTPYKNETSIEVKRLREVTSPFDSWHVDRKNKFNK